MGRLPKDVTPLAYTLELTVLPERTGFSGRTQIVVNLDRPRQRIWLHGNQLEVRRATATVNGELRPAHYRQVNEDGLASLTFRSPLPAGRTTLTLDFKAAYDQTLKGLYQVKTDGSAYAFTQFEPYSARLAFPCFDEPAFKTPFDLWLTVRDADVAVANTRELSRTPLGDGYSRVRFARTLPLPTYLIALAVGPLDVVEAEPLPATSIRPRTVPFRGVAAKGKGAQLRFALERTPAMVEALERYFATPYPFDKLDIIAVPDFAAGAMENAGAITFREWLLLLEPDQASENQVRAFSYVMAHELAHQWFGNLVTMPWWDDLWLNEAFATWMGYRVVQEVWPEQQADLALLSDVHGAMGEDSLMSARMIRQPIESTHDIVSAFDGITYRKGGGVLSMFERYLGAERFNAGIRLHMQRHALGNATSEDLMASISEAAGEDVSAAFRSFLMQAGVPEVSVQTVCTEGSPAKVSLSQQRYLPYGSAGDRNQTWQLPVCLRYGGPDGEQTRCVMLGEKTAEVTLQAGCPDWLVPNADAAGYYLWSLPAPELSKLAALGFDAMSDREQMAFARSLTAGIRSGKVTAANALSIMPRLVGAKERRVIEAPMGTLRMLHDHVADEATRGSLATYARTLYRPVLARIGNTPRKGESGEMRLLRSSVLGLLAEVGQDRNVRRQLASLGRKYLGKGDAPRTDAVPQELAPLAVRVALQDGSQADFERAYQQLVSSQSADIRGTLLAGMASVTDESRSDKALSLALDPALRVNEVIRPLAYQMRDHRTRAKAFKWLQDHFDALAGRLSARGMASTIRLNRSFCSRSHREAVAAFYGPRVEQMQGGPRALRQTLEALDACATQVDLLRPSLSTYF